MHNGKIPLISEGSWVPDKQAPPPPMTPQLWLKCYLPGEISPIPVHRSKPPPHPPTFFQSTNTLHATYLLPHVSSPEHDLEFILVHRRCSISVVQLLSHVLLFGDPMDSNPPGSSVHAILQVRILEWVAISFSRGIFLL